MPVLPIFLGDVVLGGRVQYFTVLLLFMYHGAFHFGFVIRVLHTRRNLRGLVVVVQGFGNLLARPAVLQWLLLAYFWGLFFLCGRKICGC